MTNMIGWFGVPGERTGTLTHITDAQGKPICGTKLKKNSELQWCLNTSLLTQFSDNLECKNCKRIWAARK